MVSKEIQSTGIAGKHQTDNLSMTASLLLSAFVDPNLMLPTPNSQPPTPNPPLSKPQKSILHSQP